MAEIMIFRAGKYPQGDWPKERLQKLADAYDPQKNVEAPVVIGHRFYNQTDADQYAHGWVSALRLDGTGRLFATVEDVSADVKKAVAEKKLRYISAEFWEYDKRDMGEAPYLKAVALLGRDTPAVHTAKLPAFFSRGAVSVLDEKEHIAAFTRRMDAEDISVFASGGAGQTETRNEEGNSMDELEQLKAQTESLRSELAQAKERMSAFQKENEGLRGAERKNDAAAYFSKLRDGGKLAPALFDKAAALDARLGEEERKEFRAIFGELDAKVDLSGAHAAPKGKAAAAGAGDGRLTAKIRAFQKEKHFSTFAEAAEALYAEKPELFEEGGAA